MRHTYAYFPFFLGRVAVRHTYAISRATSIYVLVILRTHLYNISGATATTTEVLTDETVFQRQPPAVPAAARVYDCSLQPFAALNESASCTQRAAAIQACTYSAEHDYKYNNCRIVKFSESARVQSDRF